jgi:hypothetical protein
MTLIRDARKPLTVVLPGEGLVVVGALGGIRTPNLLIRRQKRSVQRVQRSPFPQVRVRQESK